MAFTVILKIFTARLYYSILTKSCQ